MEGLDRRLFDVVYEIAAADDLDGLRRVVTDGAAVAVPCDLAGYTEVWLDRSEVFALLDAPVPAARTIETALARLAHQHPLITRAGGEAETISDYLTARQFRRLDLYHEVYRLLGAEDQLAINVTSSSATVIGLALNRARRSFTDRDRQRLGVLRPQIVRGYRRTLARERAQALLGQIQRGEPGSAAGLIALSQDGAVAMVSEQARRWLDAYLPSCRGGGLAPSLSEWVSVQPVGEAATLTVAGERGRLELTLLPARLGDPRLIELRERARDPASTMLTARELDILRRVAAGEANYAIAEGLSVSRRTVESHLRSIYRKLGVSNRTAAAAWLTRASEPPGSEA
jgi:DNA-binding CsgD family transcriptional regulator